MPNRYLTQRAELLGQLRSFFTDRGFTEVQTPVACEEVIPERHIELFRATDGQYLQASPEMAMKQMLCEGAGAIFQIGPAFRAEEAGTLHAAEFTMVEWYRPGDDMRAGMFLLDDLVQEVLGTQPCKRTTYRDAFLTSLALDPFAATPYKLGERAGELGIDVFEIRPMTGDDWLDLLLTHRVEDNLGTLTPEILHHYPASQAALATTTTDEQGNEVAERFELYYRGVELANGYHELTDAAELRRRLETANDQRVADGRSSLPMPEALLRSMEKMGLPPCAGCALGFDRLLMLKVGAESIAEVM